MSKLFKILVLLVVLWCCDDILAIPDDVQRCKIDDDRCLQKSANKVLRKYYRGIEDMNLKPLDPFLIKYLKVVNDGNIISVDATVNETYITGMSKGKIEKISGFDKGFVTIQLSVAKISFNGMYSSIATVLGLPIKGQGPFIVFYNDFTAEITLNLTKIENNGKENFKMVDSKLSFDFSSGKIDVPDQGYIINTFINASFNLIIKTGLTAVIDVLWAKHFGEFIDAILSTVPVEDLFL